MSTQESYEVEIQKQLTRTAFDEVQRLCFKTLEKNNGAVIDYQKQVDCHQRLMQVFYIVASSFDKPYTGETKNN